MTYYHTMCKKEHSSTVKGIFSLVFSNLENNIRRGVRNSLGPSIIPDICSFGCLYYSSTPDLAESPNFKAQSSKFLSLATIVWALAPTLRTHWSVSLSVSLYSWGQQTPFESPRWPNPSSLVVANALAMTTLCLPLAWFSSRSLTFFICSISKACTIFLSSWCWVFGSQTMQRN